MIRLELPYPVSANRYWISFYAPKLKRVCVGPTKEAKAYKAECGWRARVAGVRSPLIETVELRLTLIPKNGICMDLDNALKVAIDALKGIVYRDDSQVRKITAERVAPDGKGALVVEIDTFATDLLPAEPLHVEPPPKRTYADVGLPHIPF